MRVSEADKQQPLRVDANLLIPGRGDPISNASLVSYKDKISYVGPTSCLPEEYACISATHVSTLLPGLWDAHVHFFGGTSYSVDESSTTSPALAGARSARDIVATLNAGYTSVREMAGYGVELSQVICEGWIPGPEIYSAVAILSPTAGHADARSVPQSQLREATAFRDLPFFICDGEAECVKAVRTMVRRGAKCIKVATSGGVASSDDPYSQQFSPLEIGAIVAEAGRWGLSVAAHCHGEQGIHIALVAGCDSIEHGSCLSDDDIALMLKDDVYLVPTRSIFEFGLAHPEAWTPSQRQKLQDLASQHWDSYRRAVAAGVKVALGTDIGLSADKGYKHGMNAGELFWAVKAGMTPLQAIEAGTANPPETLGNGAPQSGQLRVGFDADFMGMDVNPLEGIESLAEPDRIRYVWKRGVCVKRPGSSVFPL